MMNISSIDGFQNNKHKWPSKLPYLFLCFCLSLFLVACGDTGTEQEITPVSEIPELNPDNLDEFTLTFANTYLNTVDTLLTEFKKYKKANDPHGFVQYRNYHWTPAYVEKKDYYLAVIEKNRAFLEATEVKPLFNKFDNLIYYGIDLKRSLLDKDRKLLDKTVAALNEQEAVVSSVIKSAGLESKFKQFKEANPISAPLNIISN